MRMSGEMGVRLRKCLAVILLVLSQVNSMTVPRRKRDHDPCPKLEFMSSHGCRPCSLCNASMPYFNLLIRSACKEKHPDIVVQPGNQKLWCDVPKGPFPECPSIAAEVLQTCTDACKDHHGRRFAFSPGCQCQVGCPGDPASSVECTRDLWWSNNSSIPKQCHPPSTATTTTAATTAVVVVRSPAAVNQHINSSDPEETTPSWQLPVIIGLCVVVVVLVGSVAVYFWRKKKKKEASSMSSSVSSSSESEKSCKTSSPLLGSIQGEKRVTMVGVAKSERPALGQAASQRDVHQNGGDVVSDEVEVVAIGDDVVVVETEGLLGREVGLGEKTPSQQALEALLKNRPASCNMARLFDQKDRFDKVTWKTVAKEFVGWDANTIHNREYMVRPSTDCSPAEGFIHPVLADAYQQGKGLLEFLSYLQNRPHFRHFDAERFLSAFWENWKQENMAGNTADC